MKVSKPEGDKGNAREAGRGTVCLVCPSRDLHVMEVTRFLGGRAFQTEEGPEAGLCPSQTHRGWLVLERTGCEVSWEGLE